MADVQKNRLEWAVYGWADRLEGWLVDKGVIPGDPENDDAVWAALAEVTQRRYENAAGQEWPIEAFGVDSGYISNRVYTFVRGRSSVFATKGMPGQYKPMIGLPTRQDVSWAGKTIKAGVTLWPLGTFALKGWVYGQLRNLVDGKPGLHFPEGCDQDFFKQITAEHLVEFETRTGKFEREWRLLKNRPNEQLDLIVGARAMASKLGLDRYTPKAWERVRLLRGVAKVEIEPLAEASPKPEPVVPLAPPVAVAPHLITRRAPVRRSSFMSVGRF